MAKKKVSAKKEEIQEDIEKLNKDEKVVNDKTTDEAQEEPQIVESELDKMKRERDELQDKYLRLYSDFENFRRRTAKEKIDLIDHASERIIVEILPVIDDFDRAMHSMSEASEINSVCEGVNII